MRHIKTILVSTALVACSFLTAQVTTMSHNISPFNCSVEKMLDLVVSNATAAEVTAVIRCEVRQDNGSVLCMATSTLLNLQPGVNRLTGRNILAEYNYTDHPVAQYLAGSGKLLSGGYLFCVKVELANGEFPNENCFPLISSYSSFLQLMNPTDRQTIEEKNPLLTWTHSGLLPVADRLETFELILVKKEKEQTAPQALAENEMHLFIPSVQSHSVLYPVNAPLLEEGSQYAWQVVHRYSGTFIESSDCWWFEVAEWEDPRDIKYVDVSAARSSDRVTVYHSFYFRFDETYNDSDLSISLYDESNKRITPSITNDNENAVHVKQSGFNGYKLNLSSYDLKAGNYVLAIANAKGKEYKINIQYKK